MFRNLRRSYILAKFKKETICMMNDWSAVQYLKYVEERSRPASELIRRIPLKCPSSIVDLGCGPGNSTVLLSEHYPNASITGIDSSPNMVQKAKADHPNIHFEQGDAGSWEPKEPVDILFANALFQWIPDQLNVLQNLVKNALKPNGVLAIQMPDNFQEPTHVLMREVANDPRWSQKLKDVARPPLPSFQTFYNALTDNKLTRNVDIWHTIYYHPMENSNDVVEWLKGTGLPPFLNRLGEDEQQEFLELYTAKIDLAYEKSANGKILLRYPRLFIVAQKR